MKHIYIVLLLIATLGIGQAWGGTEEITWAGTSLTGASSTNITAGTATAVNGDTYSAGTISISSSKIQTESKKHTADSYWEDFSASAQQVEGGVSATGTARIELPFTVGAGYNFTITDIGYKFEQGGGGGPAVHAFVVQGSTATWLNYTTASTISLTGKSIMLSAGNAKLVFVLGVASNLNNGRQFKFSNISIKGSVEAASSCTAPSSVTVAPTSEAGNYGWRYTIGETLKLSATYSGGTGTPSYQWQKYVGSDWENLTNGGDISGATSANLQINNLTSSNGGSYRCVVSTGNGCSKESDGYFVRVFTLNGNYYGTAWTENAIVWTGENTGVATVSLNASSTYMFKVADNDGKWFGNSASNFIIQPWTNDCGIENSDIGLLTGPEGNYTFTVNIEHGLDNSPYVNVQVAYPSVTHPNSGYIYINKWWNTCYVHYWEGTNNDLSTWGSDPAINSDRWTTICGTDYWYFPVIATYNKFIAKDAAGDPSNTTGDQVTTDHGGKYITHDGSWGWHDFATYSVTYDANGGTGTMTGHTGICPNGSQELTTNTFTKTDYIFGGWTTNVAVTANGNAVAAGGTVADGATLSNISSNITLTAIWTACTGPSISAFAGSAGQTYAVGDAATTMTITASAGNGGTLHYHWYQFNVGQNPSTQSIDAVGYTDANTYTPSTASAHTEQIFYCVVSEEGCSTTATSAYSGAITVNAPACALTAVTCTNTGHHVYAYNDATRIDETNCVRKDALGNALTNADVNFAANSELLGSGVITGLTSVQLTSGCLSEHKSSWIDSYIKVNSGGTITINVAANYSGTAKIKFGPYSSGSRTLTNSLGGSATTSAGSATTEDSFDEKTIALVAGANVLTAGGGNLYISHIDVELEDNSCHQLVLTYNKNCNDEVTNMPADQCMPAAANQTLASEVPVRAGYTFLGWTHDAANTNPATPYSAGYTSFTKGADNPETLYAKWGVATYSITYNCDGADSGCPSNVASATNLPDPLPSAPTKDGYTFAGWFSDSGKTTAAVAGAALTANTTLYAKWTAEACGFTLTHFGKQQYTNTPRRGFAYEGSLSGTKYVVESDDSNNKNTGNDSTAIRLNYGNKYIRILSANATYVPLNNTPPSNYSDSIFTSVTKVTFKWKFHTSSSDLTTTIDVLVGSTKVGNNISLTGNKDDDWRTQTIDISPAVNGTVKIINKGTGNSNLSLYLDDINICSSTLPNCTTPVLPSLSDQTVCTAGDLTAWNATQTATLASGETAAYSWKNSSNVEVATTASYTPAEAGTYTVTVTVSATGKSDATASKTLTATVTGGPTISTQPAGASYYQAATPTALSVTAAASNGGALSYLWYSNTTQSTSGATSTGVTTTSYTPSTAALGTKYYYCVVTEAGCGSVTSDIVAVSVSEAPCFEVDDFSKPSSGWSDRSNGGEITSSMIKGTITGGTVIYSGSGTLGCNGSYGLVFDNNNDEITITLAGGNTLPAGAVITLNARGTDGTSEHTCGFVISGHTPTPATNTSSSKGNVFTQTYTVAAADGIAGTNSFTIALASSVAKTYVYGINVSGCSSLPDADAIGVDPAGTLNDYANLAASDNYPNLALLKVYKTSNSGTNLMNDEPGNLSYQWYHYDIGANANTAVAVLGSSATTATLSSADIASTGNANYYCVVTYSPSGYNPSTAQSATWVVNKVNRVHTMTPSDPVTKEIGETQVFTTAVTDNGTAVTGLTYSWKLNGTEVATTASYTFTAPSVNANTTYTVSVTVTKDTWSSTISNTVTVNKAAVVSGCITLTNFETSTHDKVSGKPDSQAKYLYAYKSTTMTEANAVTMTTTNTSNVGKSSGAYLLLTQNSNFTIYADNTTTSGTPSVFNNVASVSLKIQAVKDTKIPVLEIYVGSTKVKDVADTDYSTSSYTTITANNLGGLNGAVKIVNKSSGSSDYKLNIDDITICYGASCEDPTPVISAAGDNLVYCSTDPVTLTATGYASGASLAWYKDGAAISGATGTSYAPTTAGSYTVKATDDCERTSNALVVTVASDPASISISPNSTQSIAVGGSVEFSTSITGVDYQWYVGSSSNFASAIPQSGETGQTFTYTGLAEGTRYVFLQTTSCSGNTRQAYVQVDISANQCYTIGTDASNISVSGTSPYTFYQGENPSLYLYNGTTSTTKVSSSTSNVCGGADRRYELTNIALRSEQDITSITMYAQVSGTRTLSSVKVGESISDALSSTALVKGTAYTAPDNIESSSCREVTFNFANPVTAGKYIIISYSSGVRVSGFCITASNCSNPTSSEFAWSSSSATVDYTDDSPALPTLTNTLGATVTYTSSDNDVATIDNSGNVSIHGVGTAIITATLPADTYSGTQYCETDAAYTLTVSCSSDPAPFVYNTGNSVTCSGSIRMAVKAGDKSTNYSAAQLENMTVYWYKTENGVRTLISTVSGDSTYTVTASGTYDADVEINCLRESSNRIIVTSDVAEPVVTKLVPFQYMHVTQTDYEHRVASRAYRHLFYIRNATGAPVTVNTQVEVVRKRQGTETNITNLTWLYMNGDTLMANTATLRNANLGLVAGDVLEVTVTPYGSCDALADGYAKTVEIRVIPADQNTIAYIVDGTNNGDFLTGVNTSHLTDEVYTTHLPNEGYIVTAVNGFAVFDRLNYEPFDLVLLTDYPKASKQQSKVNDLAGLVDYKPILSFKVHMVNGTASLPKWEAVGLKFTAVVPNPAILQMNVMCYAHPMFEGIAAELPATGTDITGCDGHTDQASAWTNCHILRPISAAGKDGKTKGLQGLELADASQFVIIATGEKNSDGDLITTCFERQNNVNARMLVMSINSSSTQYINGAGTAVLDKMLKYLLDADPTHVSDCSVIFTNNNGTGDNKWSTPSNWSTGELPEPSNNVRIEAECHVPAECHAMAANMLIRTSANEHGTTGSIVVEPGGVLALSGVVRTVTNDFSQSAQQPVTNASLITVQQSSTAAGTFVTLDETAPQATMQLYSKGVYSETQGYVKWQYIGIPVSESITADPAFRGGFMFSWDESAASADNGNTHWQVVHNGTILKPFQGYSLTQNAPRAYTFRGLMNLGDHEFDELTYTSQSSPDGLEGYNLRGNSYTAPISLADLSVSNFTDHVDATIYIYNTGTYMDWESHSGDAISEAASAEGTFIGVPVNAASYSGLNHIPAYQGFFVRVNNSATGAESFSINYDDHVYNPVRNVSVTPTLLRAPRRTDRSDSQAGYHFDNVVRGILPMAVTTAKHADQLKLLINADCSHAFDNGWDARKHYGDEGLPQIMAVEEDEIYSFNTVNNIDGQVIAVEAGDETELTLLYDMTYVAGIYPELYLHDLTTGATVDMYSTTQYTYQAGGTGETRRFMITSSGSPNPGDATGECLVRAWSADGKLFFENFSDEVGDYHIYDATGKLVQHDDLQALGRKTINLDLIPGVYTIFVRTSRFVKPIKVIL